MCFLVFFFLQAKPNIAINHDGKWSMHTYVCVSIDRVVPYTRVHDDLENAKQKYTYIIHVQKTITQTSPVWIKSRKYMESIKLKDNLKIIWSV
jgi:ribosomal protein L5